MEKKILELINKLENILIKDKRFKHDAIFKSKIININENKETETEEPIDITALFNLAKLSHITTTKPIKETIYVNNNFDLTKDINYYKQINKNISNLVDLISSLS